jgi:hypothetical protein
MNITQIQRNVRRFFESPPRNINRRALLAFVIIIIFILYVFLASYSTPPSTPAEVCVIDHFDKHAGKQVDPTKTLVSFIGNGYIGMDVSAKSELNLISNDTTFEPLKGFKPLVKLTLPFDKNAVLHFEPDPIDGMSKAVHCSIVEEKCVCVYEYVYAHRTKSNLLVQDIKITNPSLSAMSIKFERGISSEWEKQEISILPVHYRTLEIQDQKIGVAIICSSLPNDIVVHQKREESFRFMCVVEQGAISADAFATKRQLSTKALQEFTEINALHWNQVDSEHKDAWKELNRASFNISNSKAPNALNSDLIELTKFAILSAVRAPLLETTTTQNTKNRYKELMSKNELCYQGHSTLLTPSKLWQNWLSLEDVQNTIKIWMLTLKHRGCMHLVESGAHGIVQAFLLSLSAATFTHHHLEFSLDPADDLHRELNVNGLKFSPNSFVNITFDMDSEYRPLVRLSSSSPDSLLYACSGGCLDGPKRLGLASIEFPIKITKPPSPILFISDDSQKLDHIKDTLHVIAFADAPKHLPETIALHKHGENNGLPTIFWVILIFMLISFHLFLITLLYSEWKNSSSVPYSKFSKKILLRQ